MGKSTTMDTKRNDTIHVQRLKSVKLYNNPMDETTSAEMKINDEDPKGKPTGVAPPQQPKPSSALSSLSVSVASSKNNRKHIDIFSAIKG